MDDIKIGRYRHFKGHEVEVVFIAEHSETLEKMVVYHHVGENRYWVRPMSMWNDIVDLPGLSVPRFVLIEEK